ncbi:MAG: hypothetical protein C4326_04995 [Ignavibacteria bacterium]
MNREEFIERCSLYALGALEEDERRMFEAYLDRASDEERSLLSELMATTTLLPLTLERRNPPPQVKEELLQKIALTARARAAVFRRDAEARAQAPPRKPSWVPWGIAAALAMAAVFSLFMLNVLRTLDRQNDELIALRQENTRLQTRLVALEDELTRKEEQLRVLSAKELHISIMSGLQVNPVAYGKIIWDAEKGTAILHVSNLPPVPQDKDYQLWIVKGGQKISAGVFAVRDTAANFFRIDNLAVTNPKEIGAFAVTLEPKGGMPQPTGEMYMLGTPRL